MAAPRVIASRRALVARIGPASKPRLLHTTVRRRALEDPQLSHNTPPKDRTPWALILGLTALVGGTYAYYASAESRRIDEHKAELERRAARPGAIAEETKLRVKEAVEDARASSESVRDSAQAKAAAVRDSAVRTYDDEKARVDATVRAAEKKFGEANESVANVAKDVKQTWWEWIGWGRDKTAKTAEDLKRKANETEEQFTRRWEDAKAAAKAKGEEAVQRAGETEEQFRIRIARAIARKDKN